MENWKKTFAIIWTGQFFSILSSTVVGYAVIFWLSIETGSATTLAFAAIATLLPQTLIGIFAGVYVDRWDRKRTMILADSFIAFCTLILAGLFWLDIAQIGYVYVLLACRSVGSAFHMPAMQASVPLLAPASELTRVAGINQVIQSICNIAGPALGAMLLGMLNMGAILMLDVAGAVIACTSLLFVTIPNPEKAAESGLSLMKDFKDGLRAIYQKKGMAPLFLFSITVMFFLMQVSVLFPLMTLQHFSGDVFQMSLVEMLWGAGALAGGAVMGMKNYKINKVLLINLTYISLGVCFAVSGFLSPRMFVVFCILTGVSGVIGAVYNSSFIAVVQTHIDPAALGRVLSLFFSLSLLPALIGLLGTGFIAENIGMTHTFVIAGTMIFLAGIAAFFFAPMMKLGNLKS